MEDENSNVGFRFHPKDHELVDHFLRHKMLGNDSKVCRIGELNITDFEPWELPGKSVLRSDDQEWYFFCPKKPKYSTGHRSQRNTKMGQWKITGKERKVKRRGTNVVIGTKRTLVFYEGKARPGPALRRTNWVMHEYSPVNTNDSRLKPYVLCLVKKKLDENDILTHAETEGIAYEAEPSHTPVASTSLFNNGDESPILELSENQEPDINLLFDQPRKVDLSDLQLLMQEKQGPPNLEYNDYNGLQFQSGVEDEEDMEFLNSIIVEEGGVNCLAIQSVSNDSSQTESLMREYGDHDLFSSDTDAEVFHPRYQDILEGFSNELAGSKENTQIRRIELQANFSSDSREESNRGNNISGYKLTCRPASSAAYHHHSIPFTGQPQSLRSIRPIPDGEASVNRSTFSTKHQMLESLSNEVTGSKESTHIRTSELQADFSSDSSEEWNRGSNVSGYRLTRQTASSAAGHYQSIPKGKSSTNRSTLLQGFFPGKESAAESSNAALVLKKGLSNVKPDTDSELHQEMEEKLALKSRYNGWSSFIVMEAPLSVQKASSPSVYFVKALVGAVLSVGMVWELVMMGGC